MNDTVNATDSRARAQLAKEFLIAQVVEEAQRENVPLSDVERKMLYFTEAVELPYDIFDVHAQFERECDTPEYEKKIAGLLRSAFRRNRNESPDGERRWKEAVADLHKEDHYLLIMVDQSLRPVGDFWTVVMWSSVITVGIVAAIVGRTYRDGKGCIPGWVANLRLKFVILAVVGVWFVCQLATVAPWKEILPYFFPWRRRP